MIAPLPAALTPNHDVADGPTEAAIVEARQRIGSPLDGTVFAPRPGGNSDEPALVQSLRQIAAAAPAFDLPTAADGAEPPAASAAKESPPAPPMANCHLDPLLTLRASVQQLYALATRYEDQSNFGRADQVRQLARDLRDEIDRQHREESLMREPVVVESAGPPATAEAIKPAFAPPEN
jgi:hypothetical protein